MVKNSNQKQSFSYYLLTYYFCILHYLSLADASTKLLIVTGHPFEDGIHSEVIDVENYNTTCKDLTNAPYKMSWGIGGFIQSEIVICGGTNSTIRFDKCWVLGQNKTIPMKYERYGSASIVINNKVSNLN